MLKIAHLTSVHPRFDTRIFHKMCQSLAAVGHQVTLIVADGLDDESREGVLILDAGASKGRLDRIRNAPGRVFAKALVLNADLYHLHDPELIPIGLKLKRCGKRVIFDSHEDVPKQMLGKSYLNNPHLNKLLMWMLSKGIAFYENKACARFDGVVTATRFILDKFLRINSRTVDINNFPLLGELDAQIPWDTKAPEACYVGGIARIRGIVQVTQAMGEVRSMALLNLCGRFSEPAVEEECKAMPGWSNVNEYGFVDRGGVRDVLARSMAGLVTFYPLPNHIDAQPNKLFEYMSAGIPVIASDFPLWREIVLGNQCGLCVDPLEPVAIARAIDFLIEHRDEAREMGENGRRAVMERYNWANEERKLLHFYEDILDA